MKYNDYPYLGIFINRVTPTQLINFEFQYFESCPTIIIWSERKVLVDGPVTSVKLSQTRQAGVGLKLELEYVVSLSPTEKETRKVEGYWNYPFGFMLDCQNWSPSSYTLFESAVLNFYSENAVSIQGFYVISFYNPEYPNVISVSGKSSVSIINYSYFCDEKLNYLDFNYEGSGREGHPFRAFTFGNVSETSTWLLGVKYAEGTGPIQTGNCTGSLIPNSSMCILALSYVTYLEDNTLKSLTLEVLEDMFHEPCSHGTVPPGPPDVYVTGKLDCHGKFYFEIETENSNRLEISCDGEIVEEIEL